MLLWREKLFIWEEKILLLQGIWAISLIQSILYSELQHIVISLLFNTCFIKNFSEVAIF